MLFRGATAIDWWRWFFFDTDAIPVVGEGPGIGDRAVRGAVSGDLLDDGDAVFSVVFVHPGLVALGAAGHVAVDVVNLYVLDCHPHN
jgi:hypothetical protein